MHQIELQAARGLASRNQGSLHFAPKISPFIGIVGCPRTALHETIYGQAVLKQTAVASNASGSLLPFLKASTGLRCTGNDTAYKAGVRISIWHAPYLFQFYWPSDSRDVF